MSQSIEQRNAELYDASVPDWPGEIDFYHDLAAQATAQGGSLLEVACGTGRVAVRLARDGTCVVGLDHSVAMLDVAGRKSSGLPHVRWVEGDMRSFDLGETFALVIIPGHAFQHMLTPADQMACLACIRRHLVSGGRLVVHLDHQHVGWLGDVCRDRAGIFEPAGEVTHPTTGNLVRISHAWWYAPSTQTASLVTRREEIGADGQVLDRWETQPVPLHCVFRFEMEHLLAGAGFEVEAVYGDFFRHELHDESTEMIWVVRRR